MTPMDPVTQQNAALLEEAAAAAQSLAPQAQNLVPVVSVFQLGPHGSPALADEIPALNHQENRTWLILNGQTTW